MALFKRGRGEDEDGWTFEGVGDDGMDHRWRVRMDRMDSSVIADHRPVLETAARTKGQTLPDYLSWVAHMPDDELHHWRDRIIDGVATEEEAVLYNAWLDVRQVLREHQFRYPGKPSWDM
ncbi:hypothetical protein [Streptomyces sp. NPDC048172]|uniref:hypothetical protein n=1 Tax=Streptomyces sp. NPDC048172 TaxID=3365505 RepID=UPI00370FC05B